MPDWGRHVRERLPALGLAPEREAEIAEELALQLEQTYRCALRAGCSKDEARARAEAQVPDWAALAAAIRSAERPVASRLRAAHAHAVMDPRRGGPMTDLALDLRNALRSLGRSRAHAAVVVAILALGIGATTTIFSAVHGLLLRPLPFPDAGRLVFMAETAPGDRGRMSLAWPNYLDWKERTRSFEQVAAVRGTRFNLTGVEVAERLDGRMVSGEFFALLGASAQVGRLIGPDDDREGAPAVAVISDRLWRRHFGADPEVAGRRLQLSGEEFTILGVLDRGFQFSRAEDVFVPLRPLLPDSFLDRGNHVGLYALGRVKPGVTIEKARAEIETLAAALGREYPATNSGNGALVQPLRDVLVQDVRSALLVLMAGVACVLAIACVNLANVLLARGAARRSELAIRLALGASRARIVRQLVAESLVLALTGGALGVTLAYLALPLFVSWLPAGVPRIETIGIDAGVLLFALAVSVLTGLGFGVLPAVQASRPDLAGAARLSGRRTGGSGSIGVLRRALLVGQVGLAIVLVTGAGLMLRTVLHLIEVDPGFRSEQLLTLGFELSGEHYTPERRRAVHDAVLERVRSLPGVEAAGLALSLPLEGSNWNSVFVVADQPVPPRAELPSAAFTPVSPGLLETLGVRLLRGRAFDARDRADAPTVAVINETTARRFWPGRNPLGGRIKQGWPEWETPWREIVGVVADVKLEGVDVETPLQVYLPLAQEPVTGVYLAVRTAGDPERAARTIEGAVRAVDRNVPVYDVRDMGEVFAASIAPRRFATLFLSQFSAAALVLAALGVFGLMAFAVAQRRHEIGVRMALGADRGRVVREVLGEALRVVAGGVALGLLGAVVVTRLLRSLLFEVTPGDPVAFAAAVTLLLCAGLAAAYLPARRAARIDPAVALRAE